MGRLQNTFEFIGTLGFGKEIVTETVFDSGWAKKQANIIINESQSNGVFVTLEGGYNKTNSKPNKVFSFSKNRFGQKGGKLEVDWEDRKASYILDMVADFKKIVIDLTVDKEVKEEYYKLRNEIYNLETKSENVTVEDESKLKELYKKVRENIPHRYEFIHTLDAVEFITKVSEKIKGKKFRVKGEVQVSYWKEKFYTNYIPTSFELVDEETPTKLSAQLDLYYTKNAADKSMFGEEKIIRYNTYVYCYDQGHKMDKFFPLQTVFNGKNLDFENNSHDAARLKVINRYMTVEGKYVHHIPFTVSIVRGAEPIEVSMDTLTPAQLELVELGLAKAEDFKEKGTVFGETISEVRLELPLLKNFGDGNDFSSGVVETSFVEDDLIYYPVSTDTYKKPSNDVKQQSDKPLEINLDDLPF